MQTQVSRKVALTIEYLRTHPPLPQMELIAKLNALVCPEGLTTDEMFQVLRLWQKMEAFREIMSRK